MTGIDTNVLVRYLAQDDPRRSAAATKLIEQRLSDARPGFVSRVVLAETCRVLRSLYGATPGEIADTLEDLLSVPVLRFESRDAALRAVASVRHRGAEYADALIAELSAAAGCSQTFSFDRNAVRRAAMTLLHG
ncbi:MAG: type II toxin-antitoxin system VapC family toxin [Burkholderiaceae bacterium]|nr:type II toxin-antitoxin system VapC family toxin [Burkholderiaceae bacterium]